MTHLTALRKKLSKTNFKAIKQTGKHIKRTSRVLFSNSDSMLNRLTTPNTIVNDPDTIKIGNEYHAIIAMTGIPGTMKPNWLHNIVNDSEGAINFSQMIVPTDNKEAETKLNSVIRRLETGRELARIEKRQFSESENIRLKALKDRLNLLVGGKEKSFQVATYFNVHAPDLTPLERQVKRLESLLGGAMILHDRTTYRNIAGHEAMMPICVDKLDTSRSMDSTSTALTIALPGQARVSTDQGGQVVMYEHSSKMPIHFDRFSPSMVNANMAIFASSGAGKTVATAEFIIRDLGRGQDVVIIDPKGEYAGLVDELNGTNVPIHEGSEVTLNPFQLGTGPADSLNTHKQSLPAFFEMMIGTISDAGFAILDDCVNVAYLKKGITDDRMTWSREPLVMSEFYEVLYSYVNGSIEGAAHFDHSERVSALALARKIKRFATGTYRSFYDGQSTIDFSGKLINYDISAVPKDVQNGVMYLIMSQMYDYMSAKQRGNRTLYIDEAWAILASNAEHVHNMMKTCRSRRMGIVAITQDLADVMKSGIDEAILNNVGTHIVMKMGADYGNVLGKKIGLTQTQSAELPRLKKGEGYVVTNGNAMKFRIPVSERELELIESSPDFKKQAIGTLDLTRNFYRCKDLSPAEILWMTDTSRGKDKFTRYDREKTLGRGTANYLIKSLPKNQSAGHYIVVKLIAELAESMGLSTTINDYGHDFDVVIENANSFILGIEVETGMNKRADVLTKVERLNKHCAENDGIDWWFVVPGDKRKEYASMRGQTVTSGKVPGLLSEFVDKGAQYVDQNNEETDNDDEQNKS
jgi:hypothetical protein